MPVRPELPRRTLATAVLALALAATCSLTAWAGGPEDDHTERDPVVEFYDGLRGLNRTIEQAFKALVEAAAQYLATADDVHLWDAIDAERTLTGALGRERAAFQALPKRLRDADRHKDADRYERLARTLADNHRAQRGAAGGQILRRAAEVRRLLIASIPDLRARLTEAEAAGDDRTAREIREGELLRAHVALRYEAKEATHELAVLKERLTGELAVLSGPDAPARSHEAALEKVEAIRERIRELRDLLELAETELSPPGAFGTARRAAERLLKRIEQDLASLPPEVRALVESRGTERPDESARLPSAAELFQEAERATADYMHRMQSMGEELDSLPFLAWSVYSEAARTLRIVETALRHLEPLRREGEDWADYSKVLERNRKYLEAEVEDWARLAEETSPIERERLAIGSILRMLNLSGEMLDERRNELRAKGARTWEEHAELVEIERGLRYLLAKQTALRHKLDLLDRQQGRSAPGPSDPDVPVPPVSPTDGGGGPGPGSSGSGGTPSGSGSGPSDSAGRSPSAGGRGEDPEPSTPPVQNRVAGDVAMTVRGVPRGVQAGGGLVVEQVAPVASGDGVALEASPVESGVLADPPSVDAGQGALVQEVAEPPGLGCAGGTATGFGACSSTDPGPGVDVTSPPPLDPGAICFSVNGCADREPAPSGGVAAQVGGLPELLVPSMPGVPVPGLPAVPVLPVLPVAPATVSTAAVSPSLSLLSPPSTGDVRVAATRCGAAC